MEDIKVQVKHAVREVLGDVASSIFLGRVDKTIDEAAYNMEAIAEACIKVEKMVNLFIGLDEARAVNQRLGAIIGKNGLDVK